MQRHDPASVLTHFTQPYSGNGCGRTRTISSLITTLVLLILGALFIHYGHWHRPLEYDEFVTVEFYTWAGVQNTGEGGPLRRVADFHALQQPSLVQWVMGGYRSLGVWKEPNNHVVNSFLINSSLAVGPAREWIVRLPALFGAMLFATVLAYLCHRVLGWHLAAPCVAILALACPYITTFGQTARGYSVMLALQALQVACAYRLPRFQTSILTGASCVTIALLTVMNTVHMAIDWLVPLYLTLWFFPPHDAPAPVSTRPHHSRTWHANLTIQLLVILAVGGVFLMDRLPYVFSSFRQYGIPLSHDAGFWSTAQQIVAYLFPTLLWKIMGCAGMIGAVGMLFSSSATYRFLGILTCLTVGLSLLHFALTQKFPYARTCGYILPLLWLGSAFMAESTLRLIAPTWLKRLTCMALYSVLLVSAVPAMIRDVQALDQSYITEFLQVLEQAHHASTEPPLVLLPEGPSYILKKHLPPTWLAHEMSLQPRERARLFVLTYGSQRSIAMQMGRSAHPVRQAVQWPMHLPMVTAGRYGLLRFTGQIVRLERVERPAQALTIWYPNPEQLGFAVQPVYNLLAQSGVPYISRQRFLYTKLDFFSQLYAIELLANSEDEFERIRGVVSQVLRHFGGSAVVFVPHET